MITCNKCNIEQPESSYYPRNKVCKECTKKRVAEYQRGTGKISHNLSSLKYNKSEKGKIAMQKAHDNYMSNHRERKRTHWSIKRAVKSGTLIRPGFCEKCGIACKPQGHHCDYTKPLEVNWLCIKCHAEWHRNNTPIYGDVAA